MKIRYLAGEFAKLHGISKQTLIYYDKIGLFCPHEYDGETGYRYYAIEQFVDLDVVLCLKKFGMSLEEIKKYLDRSTTIERINLLKEHQDTVKNKITDLQNSQQRLDRTIEKLQARTDIIPCEMGIKLETPIHFVSQRIDAPYDDEQFEIALKILLERHNNRPDAGIEELFSTSIREREKPQYQSVALAVENKPYEELPQRLVAYIYHQGPFETMHMSYTKLLEYIAENDYQQCNEEVVERYLVDALAVSSDEDYLAEIQIQVEKI